MKTNYYSRIVWTILFCTVFAHAWAQSPITAPSFTATQYKKALWMTTRMYGGQRSGDKNTSNGNWLLFGHSLANDGRTFLNDADAGYDLSGGWFDCGDHVKFGHTEFWSAYLLLKGFAEFAPGYDDRYAANYQGYRNANNYTFEGSGHAPNNIPDLLDEVKHATDYLIKCTRDNNNFYYQVGDGGADHMQWVTAAKMQNNPVNTGGQPRVVHKNPADGAMPSLAGAALALMSRLYRPYDATYADLCLTHAKYAYNYAKTRKTQTVGAPGGFYGINANPLNAYAILLTELYWSSKDEAYKTEAMAMTVAASSSSADVRGNPYGLDYVNNGDIAVYNMYLLGKPGADVAFNTIVNTHYLANVQNDGQFAGGNTSWGPLRYNASAALVVALWTKRNSITAGAKTFIYSNVDFILGKNSRNYSFVVGFASNGASHPHHRNVFMSDANNNSNLTIPAKNQQHGYMVGGKRNPNDYQDVTDSYQNTEGGIDYNSALVGVLAWINIQVGPVNKFTVPDVVAATPSVTLTAPANNSKACAGNSITITAAAEISSGSITKIEFYDGSTLLGSDNSSPYSYIWSNPTTGAHAIKAIAISADNVSSTAAASNITVNALPVVTPNIQTNSGAWVQTSSVTVCGGSSVVLGPSPVVSTGWSWTGPGGFTSTNREPHMDNITTAKGGAYVATYTDANGCSGTSTMTVNVTALPGAPTVNSPVSYCLNATATALTAAGTGLKWYTKPTTGTGSATAPTPVTTSTGTKNYYVSQTSGNCESARATIAVVTHALPDAVITANTSTSFCQGESVTLTASAGVSYKWFNGTAQVGTSQNYTAISSGSYSVEVANAAGCRKTSASTPVSVTTPSTWYADADGDGKGNPNATLSACTKPTGYVTAAGDACPDDANKTAPGNCGCGMNETSCLDCAGVPNGTAAPDVCQRCAGGTTGVTPVTNPSLCPLTATSDPAAAALVRLSPNPSNDHFKLELPFSSDVRVVTTEGRQVDSFSKAENLSFGMNYAKGIYFILITNDRFTQVLRVIKH